MNEAGKAMHMVSRGDRILLALFIPPFIGILGWLAWLPHHIQTSACTARS